MRIQLTVFRTLLYVLVMTSLPIVSAAQESQPGDDASFRSGPLRFTPTVALRNVGLDSNVFNNAAGAGPESDFTATLTPAADVWMRVGRLRMTSRHSADFVYFQSHADQRFINTANTLKVEASLNRLTPWVSAQSLFTRDRPGYEIDLRPRRVENTLSAGLDLAVGHRTTVTAALRHTSIAFDPDAEFAGASLRRVLDHHTDVIEVAARHKLTPFTTAAVLASTGRERFNLSPERNNDSVRVTPGLALDARIRGSVFVGYAETRFASARMPDFRGLVASANMSYTFFGSTNVAVGTARDLSYSYEIERPYYVQTGINGTVTQHLVAAWDVQARLAQERLAYRHAADSAGAAAGIDRVVTVGAGIGYHLSPEVRLGVNVDRHRRRSDVAGRDYERYTAGTSVAFTF